MSFSNILSILRKKPLLSGIVAIIIVGLLYTLFFGKKATPPKMLPQSIQIAVAQRVDVPRFFHGLGTVTAFQDTVVRSRVDGYLTVIHFQEGQYVQKGDPLIEIDARPFRNKLNEAKGALVRDEALLKNARQDLKRYTNLLKQDAVPVQQVQAQEALVGQYEGAVIQDKAAVAEAELQLSYCTVVAPFSGKAGLRQVDIGATVSANDSAGIVRLTQTQPCYVVFTLVDKYLLPIRDAIEAKKMHAGNASSSPTIVQGLGLKAEVWAQDGKKLLSEGYLDSLDNQIDRSTGTIKAKAIIPNEDNRLYPNQFVNVRLYVDTMENALTVPSAAVQRNNTGYFVYIIDEGKAKLCPIEITFSNDTLTVIASGISEGDTVITDGIDRLRDGTPVRFTPPIAESSSNP